MADFSRKHYVAIANIINNEIESIKNSWNPFDECDTTRHEIEIAKSIAVKLAGLFGADNPQFDWHRFYTACGLDADKLLSEEA